MYLILILVILVTGGMCMRVSSPPEISGDYPSPKLFFGLQTFSITGRLVVTDGKRACQPLSLQGETTEVQIALVSASNCYPGDKAFHVEFAGYQAAVISNDRNNLGLLRYYWNGEDYSDIGIPVVEILPQDYEILAKYLLDPKNNVTIELNSTDHNPWDDFDHRALWPLYILLIAGFNTIIFFLAVHRIYGFIREYGLQPSLPQIVLAIELLSCVVRYLYILDPFSLYEIIPWGVHEAFLTNSFTLSLVTNALIAFYWQEVLHTLIPNQSEKISFKLDRFKWPCVIVVSISVAFEIVTSVLFGLLINGGVVVLFKGLMFILTGLACSAFFIYTGIQVIRTSRTNKNVVRLALMIIASGVFIMLFVVVSLFVPLSFDTPATFYMINLFAFLATEGISFNQVLVLRTQNTKKAKSQTSGQSISLEKSISVENLQTIEMEDDDDEDSSIASEDLQEQNTDKDSDSDSTDNKSSENEDVS